MWNLIKTLGTLLKCSPPIRDHENCVALRRCSFGTKLNGHPSASRHVYIGSAHVECDVSYQTRFENAFALRHNLN